MARLASAQARDLRRRLFTQLIIAIVLFTAVYALFCLYAEWVIVPDIAERVADATAPWSVMDEEHYLELQDALVNAGRNPLDMLIGADGLYYVRDLTIYRALSSLKMPVALGLYLIGCIVIVVIMLNRATRYFDELADAVSDLLADRSKPIDLPDDLSIVRAELAEVRNRSLADDRAAAAAERRKNELVAYLAHDIKTPLTSIVGYTSLLKESPDLPPETRARYAGIAYDKAIRLDDLIDEFFEITRYNLAAIPLERERVNVALLCQQVADELFPEAKERGITISIEAPEDIEAFIDPEKIARALSNVMRNAVAYADEASTVVVRAAIVPPSIANDTTPWPTTSTNAAVGSSAMLRITIENTGREISDVHLKSIFEKFFREDSARQTNHGGAGLGLAIAKEIVTAHGGTIGATSSNGQTVFTIDVPRDGRFVRISQGSASPL